MTAARPLFLTDVDDTLVTENTTFGFLRAVAERRGAVATAALAALVGPASPVAWALAGGRRVWRADAARTLALRVLRSQRRDDLDAVAGPYARRVLERRPHGPGLAHLGRAQAEGAEVVLVTSSVDVVVAPLAAALGVGWRASELEWQDGRATGRLRRDLTGAKLAAVADLLEGAGPVTVMTDNLSDWDLLVRADRRLVVLHDPRRAGRWAALAPEFVTAGADGP